MRIEKYLKEWKEAGILTITQYEEIMHFESSRKKNNYYLFTFLGLGILSIILGIIALISSNWHLIANSFKIITFFLMWFTTGAILFYAHKKESLLLKESLMIFYSLLMFAGIGLIGQIYHLSGPLENTLFFYSGTMLYLVLHSQRHLMALLWFLIFSTATLSLADHHHRNEAMIHSFYIFFITLGIFKNFLHLKYFQKFQDCWHLFSMSFLTLIVPLLGELLLREPQGKKMISSLLIFGVLFIFSILSFLMSQKDKIKISQSLLLLNSAIIFLIIKINETHAPFLACFFFITTLIISCYYSYLKKNIYLFRFFTIILAFRLLAVFFEVFVDLATTGFGLILFGSLLVGIVILWNHFVKKCFQPKGEVK